MMNPEKEAVARKIHALVNAGLTWKAAAALFGLNMSTAHSRCVQLKLHNARNGFEARKLLARGAYELVKAGATWEALAKPLGIKPENIRSRATKVLGLAPLGPKPAPAAEREERLQKALDAFLHGVDQVQACEKAGISVGCFRRWRAKKGIKPSPAEMYRLRNGD